MKLPEEITLRDLFAMTALEGDVQAYQWGSVSWGGRKHFTREEARYRFADAMLEQRNAEKDGVQ